MGEAKRRAARLYGGRAHLVEAEMRIVRFRPEPGRPPRVEFFLGGFAPRDAYEAVCAIKGSFEAVHGFATAPEGAPKEPAP